MNMKFMKDDGNERKNQPPPSSTPPENTNNGRERKVFSHERQALRPQQNQKASELATKKGFTSLPMRKSLSSHFQIAEERERQRVSEGKRERVSEGERKRTDRVLFNFHYYCSSTFKFELCTACDSSNFHLTKAKLFDT